MHKASQYNSDIFLSGTQKDINYADQIIKELPLVYCKNSFDNNNIAKNHAILQQAIEDHKITASILFLGNGIWNKGKIVRNCKLMKKSGMDKMGNYTYDFLSLDCGSIAHFNKRGWISCYPTIEDFKRFLIRNEFGYPVLQHIPAWKTDAKNIIKEIYNIFDIKI